MASLLVAIIKCVLTEDFGYPQEIEEENCSVREGTKNLQGGRKTEKYSRILLDTESKYKVGDESITMEPSIFDTYFSEIFTRQNYLREIMIIKICVYPKTITLITVKKPVP